MGESNIIQTQFSYIDDIRMTVDNASKVIVPLSPISVLLLEVLVWIRR